MRKKKSKIKKAISAVLSVLVVVIVFSIINSILTDSYSSNDNNDSSTKDTSSPQQTEEVKDDEKTLYEDNNFKITYIGITDTHSGLTMYTMALRLENKSENNVLISLKDSYINDTQILFIGGNLSFDGTLPGKKSVCTFTFGYDNLGIKSIEDIKTIEFKIELHNPDEFSEVYLETDTIKIML